MLSNFNKFMMQKAFEVSKTSTCRRKQVGAILTFNPNILLHNYKEFKEIDYADTIISVGSNRSLSLDETCQNKGCLIFDGHCERTRHAEICAFDNNKCLSFTGKWLFVTCAPCIKCLQEIIIKGIKDVWYADDSYWDIRDGYRIYVLNLAEKYDVKLNKVNV